MKTKQTIFVIAALIFSIFVGAQAYYYFQATGSSGQSSFQPEISDLQLKDYTTPVIQGSQQPNGSIPTYGSNQFGELTFHISLPADSNGAGSQVSVYLNNNLSGCQGAATYGTPTLTAAYACMTQSVQAGSSDNVTVILSVGAVNTYRIVRSVVATA